MLAFVNGMDAVNYKQLRNVTAWAGSPNAVKVLGWMMWIPLTLRMLAIVNGMDAVSYEQFRNLNDCFGYPILLSSGMDAVNSPNPDGCLLLSMGWMLWSHLTSWVARSTRATWRTKASAWGCCCWRWCSRPHKWMDAVNSTSPENASPGQWNGCCEL